MQHENVQYIHEYFLTNHLAQIFRYLRDIALKYKLSQMFGVLTDYKRWYFVRYDLQKELEAVFNPKFKL